MNDAILAQKTDALLSFPRLRPESVRRLAGALRELDDWDATRINPLRFAAEHGLAEDEAVDLFVHGAKVGLFDFVWNLICPACGALVVTDGSPNALDALAHCALCDCDVESYLDDQVEVAFSLNPSVGRRDVDAFANAESYWRATFSPNFERPERALPLMREATLGTELPRPDEVATFSFDAEAGRTYRLVSIERNVSARITVAETGAAGATFDLLPGGVFPGETVVGPGRTTAAVRNLGKTTVGVVLVRSDERIGEVVAEEPPRMRPFLTGKLLLNNQSFRDLFRVQQLVPGLRLPLRSLTILFTDLKGSTALYDRTGDAGAFALVRAHYDQLAESVRASSGAVIKTMGDAIMASFSSPLDAVRAAVDMLERIEALNASWRDEGFDLGIKIGLHEGPALAVNADDRLDYFGQTVNIAARVQNLAEAGEIWHTERVLASDGVERLLRSRGYASSAHSVSLKGVGETVLVHQWRHDE
jgi:class 3 adenylate cyclase